MDQPPEYKLVYPRLKLQLFTDYGESHKWGDGDATVTEEQEAALQLIEEEMGPDPQEQGIGNLGADHSLQRGGATRIVKDAVIS